MVASPELHQWSGLSGDEWPTLLLGNGFSTNLWSRFGYASLFAEAELDAPARTVFAELETSNFETALECLHHARVTLRALGEPEGRVEALYDDVRGTLFRTVSSVHVRSGHLSLSRATTIAKALSEHRAVFTTNYDLTLYWAVLKARSRYEPGLLDYFYKEPSGEAPLLFDPTHRVFQREGLTRLHYLHGAIHLWQDDAGRDGKWTNAQRGNLLDMADDDPAADGRRPLFVSEGTAAMKDSRIRRSPYLSFCRDQLTADSAPTVVLGHSLARADQHVAAALNTGPRRLIAVSVWTGGGPQAVERSMNHAREMLPDQELVFFDSSTHPLGSDELTLEQVGPSPT